MHLLLVKTLDFKQWQHGFIYQRTHFAINLHPLKLQKAQSSERLRSKYYMSMVKHTFLKSPEKEIHFSL